MKVEHKDTPDAGLANLFKVANGRKVEQAPVSLASDAPIAATIKGLDRFS